MSYVNIDTRFAHHPDISDLSNGAFRLHIAALLWCKEQDEEGMSSFVVKHLMGMLRRNVRRTSIDELVERGVWFIDEEGNYVPGGHHRPRGEDRPAIPLRVRYQVMLRDGNVCQICGAAENLSLDHIIPFSHGGPDTVDNLRTLCRRCNARRGAARKTDDELRGIA